MTVPDGGPADVVLSREQFDVGTEWFRSGRLRVRKQIVAYTHTVELTLHREELVIEVDHVVASSPDGSTWAGTSHGGPPIAPPIAQPPRVFLLREEVPQITLVTRAYERATTHSVLVSKDVSVVDTLRREQAVLEGLGPASPTDPEISVDWVQLSQTTRVEPD